MLETSSPTTTANTACQSLKVISKIWVSMRCLRADFTFYKLWLYRLIDNSRLLETHGSMNVCQLENGAFVSVISIHKSNVTYVGLFIVPKGVLSEF